MNALICNLFIVEDMEQWMNVAGGHKGMNV